jgi:hypothetical protein
MEQIQIFVNTPKKVMVVNIIPNKTTGLELKKIIINQIGGDLKLLRLMSSSCHTIDDADIVTEKNVKNNDTINALIRMLSCAGKCPNC